MEVTPSTMSTEILCVYCVLYRELSVSCDPAGVILPGADCGGCSSGGEASPFPSQPQRWPGASAGVMGGVYGTVRDGIASILSQMAIPLCSGQQLTLSYAAPRESLGRRSGCPLRYVATRQSHSTGPNE